MASQSQQTVTVSTIVMTTNTITPSTEASVDPQIIIVNFIGIVASHSQEGIMVSAIVTTTDIITPSMELSVDPLIILLLLLIL